MRLAFSCVPYTHQFVEVKHVAQQEWKFATLYPVTLFAATT